MMMRRELVQEMGRAQWSSLEWRASLLCIPAVGIALAAGFATGHPRAGVVMAGGAQCVGFGSFQKPLGGLRGGPMLLAAVGTALSAGVGEMVAREFPLLLLAAMLWAFTYGMSGAISSPASWVGQQCCIFLVISSAVPGTAAEAGIRALGVIAGGLLQALIVWTGWRFVPQARSAIPDPEQNPEGWQWSAMRRNLTLHSQIFRYALRLAGTAAVSVLVYHKLGFLNAYWVPMTALIVLKPERLLTNARALNRVAGTMLGGALATAVAVAIRPSPASLTLAVLVFLYLSYALQLVNYGIFSVFVTCYIVFLLAAVRMPENLTIYHRIIATAIGGGLGMLAHAVHLRREQQAAVQATSPA